jgi:hypothetical protein
MHGLVVAFLRLASCAALLFRNLLGLEDGENPTIRSAERREGTVACARAFS